jgi:hypothetical protein
MVAVVVVMVMMDVGVTIASMPPPSPAVIGISMVIPPSVGDGRHCNADSHAHDGWSQP